jgi:hypothetical protein
MKLKDILLLLVAVAILGVAAFRLVQWSVRPDHHPVDHLFWCANGHIHTFDQVKKAGRVPHPAGGREGASVLVCAEAACDAPSYPVQRCEDCGTRYVLFLMPHTECPQCNPEYARIAADRGVNLTPPELPR